VDNCNVCGGELTYLGWLGNWLWGRCRDCGAEQHRERDAQPEQEADRELKNVD
jgi:hypothetical protein